MICCLVLVKSWKWSWQHLTWLYLFRNIIYTVQHCSKRVTKNPRILVMEGSKFYCNTITVPKNEEDTQNFHYCCAEKHGGCRASATIAVIKVSLYYFRGSSIVIKCWNCRYSLIPISCSCCYFHWLKKFIALIFFEQRLQQF